MSKQQRWEACEPHARQQVHAAIQDLGMRSAQAHQGATTRGFRELAKQHEEVVTAVNTALALLGYEPPPRLVLPS